MTNQMLKRTHTTLNLIEGKPSWTPILVQAINKMQQSLDKKKRMELFFDKFDKRINKSVISVSYLSVLASLSSKDLAQTSSR